MADFTIIWTEKAYASLRKAHDFMAEGSPEGAKNVVRELVQLS